MFCSAVRWECAGIGFASASLCALRLGGSGGGPHATTTSSARSELACMAHASAYGLRPAATRLRAAAMAVAMVMVGERGLSFLHIIAQFEIQTKMANVEFRPRRAPGTREAAS